MRSSWAWLAVLVLTLLAGGVAAWLWLKPKGTARSSAARVTLPEAAGAWRASGPPTSYDRESIYGYIDGHAEVYLAYGMRSCQARRYLGPAGEPALTLDLFELASPEDAYGAFTHDRDGEPVGVGRDSLFRYGWLSFWKGRHFVSIVAESETEASKRAVLALGRAVAEQLPDQGGPPTIVGALPALGLDPRSVRFLRSQQILNTHRFVDAENLFGLGPDTAAALGQYSRGDSHADLLLIEYPDPAALQRALAAFERRFPPTVPGTSAQVKDVHAARVASGRLAAVLAADSESLALALLDEALGRAPRATGSGGPP